MDQPLSFVGVLNDWLSERAISMGKRRTGSVSRIAVRLLNNYPKHFTNNYDENKKVLDELIYFPSKVLRNKVAGYIVRLKKGE